MNRPLYPFGFALKSGRGEWIRYYADLGCAERDRDQLESEVSSIRPIMREEAEWRGLYWPVGVSL